MIDQHIVLLVMYVEPVTEIARDQGPVVVEAP